MWELQHVCAFFFSVCCLPLSLPPSLLRLSLSSFPLLPPSPSLSLLFVCFARFQETGLFPVVASMWSPKPAQNGTRVMMTHTAGRCPACPHNRQGSSREPRLAWRGSGNIAVAVVGAAFQAPRTKTPASSEAESGGYQSQWTTRLCWTARMTTRTM